jgi:hypothetical protein
VSLFVVRRKVSEVGTSDDVPEADAQYSATFTDRAAAEEHARRLDWHDKMTRKPADFDPFPWGATWDQICTMPPPILRDWLRDEDIEPAGEIKSLPKHIRSFSDEVTPWRHWWRELVAPKKGKPKKLTKAQWERIWLGLNRFTTTEVVEAPPDAALTKAAAGRKRPTVVYAVVHRDWHYNDEGYVGSNGVQLVYRTRAAAEKARDREEREIEPALREYPSVAYEYVVVELPLDQVAEG